MQLLCTFFRAYFSTATLSITELKSHYTWVILNFMSDSERGGGGGGGGEGGTVPPKLKSAC